MAGRSEPGGPSNCSDRCTPRHSVVHSGHMRQAGSPRAPCWLVRLRYRTQTAFHSSSPSLNQKWIGAAHRGHWTPAACYEALCRVEPVFSWPLDGRSRSKMLRKARARSWPTCIRTRIERNEVVPAPVHAPGLVSAPSDRLPAVLAAGQVHQKTFTGCAWPAARACSSARDAPYLPSCLADVQPVSVMMLRSPSWPSASAAWTHR
jgi:hypothetical protein